MRLRRLRVLLPPGKLDIAVDKESSNMPIVHEIMETSVLNSGVNMGDLLTGVDEVDHHGIAVHVLRLISLRE